MRILLILAGLTMSLAAASQEIYRWVDKDGIVHYADQPGAADAELVTVIESNVYEGEATTPDSGASGSSSADQESEPTVSPYESLSIIQPPPDEVFFGSDVAVSVQAELEGTLRPDHTVVFFLNGNRRPASGLGMQLSGLARGTYFLRASILDRNGNAMITSQQTTFHVRQPSLLAPKNPLNPRQGPAVKPRG